MSRKKPVTKEQIIAAIEQIVANGENLTLVAIKGLTGGSYSTIGPVLKEWKEARKADTHI